MHYGTYDETLEGLKSEHKGEPNNDVEKLQTKPFTPWGSDIPLSIFIKLLNEGYNIDHDLAIKGNDMELFHFLSAGNLDIDNAPQRFGRHLRAIGDLILEKRFVPFPPRPKPKYGDSMETIRLMQARNEEYPPKDAYENYGQLNVLARAILIHPHLVTLWKEIGYNEICSDVNGLVMQGALSILFPPLPADDWQCPDVDTIVTRLKQLIDYGFRLTDQVIEEAFHLFEQRLDEVGDLLLNSFQIIRQESVSDIANSCVNHALHKTNLLKFLIDKIERPDEVLDRLDRIMKSLG